MQDLVDLAFEPTRAFVDDAQCVLFFARRGGRVLRCYVTLKTLVNYFGADPDGPDGPACLRAYDAHRATIQRVAQGLLDEPERRGDKAVVITTSEMFRAMVQGPLQARRHLHPAGAPAHHG